MEGEDEKAAKTSVLLNGQVRLTSLFKRLYYLKNLYDTRPDEPCGNQNEKLTSQDKGLADSRPELSVNPLRV